MKEFLIPLINTTLQNNTDETLQEHEVEGIELEYLWQKKMPRELFTGAFIAAGTDGLGISFCSELPKNEFTAIHTKNKTKVFEDDCVELFLMPQNSKEYFCWEINPLGKCLDYKVLTDISNKTLLKHNLSEGTNKHSSTNVLSNNDNSSEIINSYVLDVVAEKQLLFEYNWKSNGIWKNYIEDEFWYLEIFIPWEDFGLKTPPEKNDKWKGTLNRIDITGAKKRKGKKTTAIHNGLLTLIDDTPYPQFHQPDHFAEFIFI